MQGQPDAQVYRNRTLMNFNDLCLIYAYTQADGRYSRSSHDIDFDDDAQGMNFGVFLLLIRFFVFIGIDMCTTSDEQACGK